MDQITFTSLILWRVLQGFDFDPDFLLFLAPETGDYEDIDLETANSFLDLQIILPEITQQPLTDEVRINNLRKIGILNHRNQTQ
ncbi:hypothetical protein H7X65_02180 [Candidatus Parcubacteria bacterium]|nr:hypothetical protein [Candidatus Parcubacteria bacterium]